MTCPRALGHTLDSGGAVCNSGPSEAPTETCGLCLCPWPPGPTARTRHGARGPGPHLDLHGVLRLGFLSVQQLNGHNHLPFALEEHHLGKVGGKA